MPIRAKIIDSEVRSTWRVIPFLAAARLREGPPRHADVECGPGYIELNEPGGPLRIHAKEVLGATTAATPEGLLVTLQLSTREQPLTLELANDTEGDKVRHALGIGHGGYGTVGWRTHPDGRLRDAKVMRLLGVPYLLLTVACLLAFLNGVMDGRTAENLIPTMGYFAVVVLLAIRGAMSRSGPQMPSVSMTSAGVKLLTPDGWFTLPYEALGGIKASDGVLEFRVPPPYNSVAVQCASRNTGGLLASDQNVLMTQLLAAAARARGMSAQKMVVADRLQTLRRGAESPRDWLMRLDATGQMLAPGIGYRSGALDVDDLWAMLEDPEGDADLRAAAARVLRHAPETRVRIESAVAAVRDEPTNRRIRIALAEDVESASEALDQLDASARRPQYFARHG